MLQQPCKNVWKSIDKVINKKKNPREERRELDSTKVEKDRVLAERWEKITEEKKENVRKKKVCKK